MEIEYTKERPDIAIDALTIGDCFIYSKEPLVSHIGMITEPTHTEDEEDDEDDTWFTFLTGKHTGTRTSVDNETIIIPIKVKLVEIK